MKYFSLFRAKFVNTRTWTSIYKRCNNDDSIFGNYSRIIRHSIRFASVTVYNLYSIRSHRSLFAHPYHLFSVRTHHLPPEVQASPGDTSSGAQWPATCKFVYKLSALTTISVKHDTTTAKVLTCGPSARPMTRVSTLTPRDGWWTFRKLSSTSHPPLTILAGVAGCVARIHDPWKQCSQGTP